MEKMKSIPDIGTGTKAYLYAGKLRIGDFDGNTFITSHNDTRVATKLPFFAMPLYQ